MNTHEEEEDTLSSDSQKSDEIYPVEIFLL